MRKMVLVVAVILSLVLPGQTWANSADYCSGDAPQLRSGFAGLQAQLGDTMGRAITCEYPDPKGTGDVEQNTTAGLAFWRKSTNVPTFTDGVTHWAFQSSGVVSWAGTSIDPPATSVATPSRPVSAAPVPATPATPATALPPLATVVQLYRCRQFCFMAPDGSGQAALIEIAGMLTPSGGLSLLGAAKAARNGDIYRLTANATVRVDTPDASTFPHIMVVDGAHAGVTGHTIWPMLAALP